MKLAPGGMYCPVTMRLMVFNTWYSTNSTYTKRKLFPLGFGAGSKLKEAEVGATNTVGLAVGENEDVGEKVEVLLSVELAEELVLEVAFAIAIAAAFCNGAVHQLKHGVPESAVASWRAMVPDTSRQV